MSRVGKLELMVTITHSHSTVDNEKENSHTVMGVIEIESILA